MENTNILSISIEEYKNKIKELEESLKGLKSTSDEYVKTLDKIKDYQDKLNEALGKSSVGVKELSEQLSKVKPLNVGKSTDSLKEFKKETDNLKVSLLNLDEGSEEYAKILNEVKERQTKLNEVMAIGKKNTDHATGSYYSLQEELKNVKKEAKELEGGINNPMWETLAKRGKEISAQLKEMDADFGDFFRNVGNYKNSFLQAFEEMKTGPLGFAQGLETLNKTITGQIEKFGSLKGALGGVATQIGLVGKQMWALVANPVGAAIAAVAVALMMLMKGLQGTEENANRFNGILAKLQPVIDVIDREVQAFAKAFLDVAEPLMNVIDKLGLLKGGLGVIQLAFETVIKPIQLFGMAIQGVSDLIDPLVEKWNNFMRSVANSQLGKALGLSELQQLSDLEDKLAQKKAQYAKDERTVIEENAKLQKDASDLREKGYDRENYSAKQRKAFIIAYHKLQQKELANNLRIKQEQYKIALMEATKAGNTAETNKKLAEQRAELLKIKATMADDNTALSKELKKLNAEIANGNKVKQTSVKSSKQEKDLVSERLKLEERLLNLRITNDKTNIKLQAQLIDVRYRQEKRSIEKEVKDQKMKNDLIFELNKKLATDLKNLYKNVFEEIDKNHIDNLKDQLSRLKQYQQDYNTVFQQIMTRSAEEYENRMKKMISDKTGLPLEEAEKWFDEANRIGLQLIEVYKQADKIAVETGEDINEVAKRIIGTWKENNEGMYQWARVFEDLTQVSVGNFASQFKYFSDQMDDNLKRTEDDYNKRNILYQENLLNEKIANDASYKYTLEYSKKKMDLVKQEYDGLLKYGKLSTENDEEYNKRRIELLNKLKEAERDYDDAIVREAEESQNGELYFNTLREQEEIRHYDEMLKIAKDFKEAISNNTQLTEEDKLQIQKQYNQQIEQEERKHSKRMQKIEKDQAKRQKMNAKDWLNVYSRASTSIASVFNDFASMREDQLNREVEHKEKSEQQAKEEFETIKDFQIAAATVDMLGALVASNASIWSEKGLNVWAKIALCATESAAILASGMMNIDQIKNTQFGGGGSTSSGSASRTVDFSSVAVNPLLSENADMLNVQNVNVVSDQTTNGDQRVWISQSDITNSNRQVELRERNVTF